MRGDGRRGRSDEGAGYRVLAAPGLKAARRAPAGEVLQVDGAHYAAFLDQHETVVAAELDYLRRHLLQDNDGQR